MNLAHVGLSPNQMLGGRRQGDVSFACDKARNAVLTISSVSV